MVRVCFVCLGNICRSPTAEGLMRDFVATAGLSSEIEVDSAGTSANHVGESPDRRSTAAAARHGVQLHGQSRQFQATDFERFDFLLAMDGANLRAMRRFARTDAHRAKLHLMRDFDPHAEGPADVPDPYYGDGDGFERVFQMCRRSCEALLHQIRTDRGL